jgi:hypothetical protein
MAVVFGFGPLHEKQGLARSAVAPILLGVFGRPARHLHRDGHFSCSASACADASPSL